MRGSLRDYASPKAEKQGRGIRSFRVTNAQRACVCALILAGQNLVSSCKVAGVAYLPMHDLLPGDWTGHRNRSARKWKGDALRDLEEAYRDNGLKVERIAGLFGISGSMIRKLARTQGWPRRKRGYARLPKSIRAMSKTQYNSYRKLRPVIGREAAVQAVFG